MGATENFIKKGVRGEISFVLKDIEVSLKPKASWVKKLFFKYVHVLSKFFIEKKYTKNF